MRCITDAIPFFMNDVYPTNKDCVVSDIDLEEPYCIEVSEILTSRAHLDYSLLRKESRQGYALPKILELMRLSLKIVKTTFLRLSISNVIPTVAGFERIDLKHLKDLLLNYTYDKALPEDIQCSAGVILVEGFDIIHIESSERVNVVIDVLEKSYSPSDNSDMTKGVFAYTTNILKRYGNNVIDLLPRGHEYCTVKQAEEYTKPLSKFFVFGVESSLLIIKSGGSKINDISKITTM